MSAVITDIWFVADIGLKELANQLGLTNINFDSGFAGSGSVIY